MRGCPILKDALLATGYGEENLSENASSALHYDKNGTRHECTAYRFLRNRCFGTVVQSRFIRLSGNPKTPLPTLNELLPPDLRMFCLHIPLGEL